MGSLRPEFGLSLVAAGWVSSMINTLGVSTGILFGLLGDRLGALRTCYAGLAASILGGVLGLAASGQWRNALRVTAGAAACGVVLGLALRRIKAR
ncbi:MAG: hypothetical protein M0P95_10210 [Sulfuritalea sp.]|jgi:cyanate permease|nr:hypothetical protein [Sulfuritalea sp.]